MKKHNLSVKPIVVCRNLAEGRTPKLQKRDQTHLVEGRAFNVSIKLPFNASKSSSRFTCTLALIQSIHKNVLDSLPQGKFLGTPQL